MALTKSAARTRVRQRIRDTVTTYEFSDTVLDGYLPAALKGIAVHVLAVDPDFYLSLAHVNAYTDALDKVNTSDSEQGYEFYPLPVKCGSLRRVERADGGFHYSIPIVDPMAQEAYRHGLFSSGRVAHGEGGTTYTNLSTTNALGAIAIWGNRFRHVPAPAAAGVVWRLYYDREPYTPEGESENVDIPAAFEEALCLSWGEKVIAEDGDPLAQVLEKKRDEELAIAREQHRKRTLRAVIPQPVW